ncbi:acyl-CoA dehydrogenase family protein [Desulfoluna sp.]|uniref:acyl-CoA dehydrogenase family protein n=1 Tax=Desulfoluna sp. TaxID=2045199 RepID=UPI00261C7F29|nr:acyl-CoA dehydrogenase family protein [Desulfoluna sp.]
MNFDYSQDELDLFHSLETILGKTTEVRPKNLISKLAWTGYATLGENGLAGALPGAQERLAQWKPAAYRTMEYGLRIAATTLRRFGPEAWHATWVTPIQQGKILATAALDQAEGEPDLTGKPHDKGYLINGTKTAIPGAISADVILASGTVEESPALFLFQKETGDVSLTQGATGLYTLTAHETFLPDTQVAILSKKTPLAPFLDLLKNRIQIAEATGHAAALFDQAKTAAKTCPEGGKPPIAKQEIGFKLATMYTLLQTSRLMSANASGLIDANASDAAMASSCARVFCSDAANEIISSALEVMGENGFKKGGPADRLAAIQALRVEGPSVGQTKEAIGNMLLKY